MRRALFGLILAASALTPAAAIAQHHHGGGDRGDRGESRGNRGESHGSRQGGQSREARQAPQQAPQQARPQAVQRQGGNRQGARPNFQGRANFQGRPNFQGRANFQGDRGPRATPQAVRPQGVRGNRGPQGRPGSVYPRAWQGNPNSPQLRHYQQLERRNQYRNGTVQQRQEIRRSGDRRGGAHSRRNWGHDWNRGWRNDRRYDWNHYRANNRRQFHLSRYYAPYRNWNYRRFSIGLFLDPLFYGQSYWLGDPYYYRLPPAPPGTQWVRYYDDVLLVDVYSGEVVDAIYDFFE